MLAIKNKVAWVWLSLQGLTTKFSAVRLSISKFLDSQGNIGHFWVWGTHKPKEWRGKNKPGGDIISTSELVCCNLHKVLNLQWLNLLYWYIRGETLAIFFRQEFWIKRFGHKYFENSVHATGHLHPSLCPTCKICVKYHNFQCILLCLQCGSF